MFAHLHCRSYFSLKDGAFSPEDLVRRAAELGMPAVALTDRDGLYGAPRFVAACNAAGIKPLLGAYLTVDGGQLARGWTGAEALRRSGAVARHRRAASAGGSWGAEGTSAESRTGAPGGAPSTLERRSPRRPASGTTRVLLLARDARGYANLCRLITAAHMRGERGDPWLSPGEVMARSEGLVCLLGPDSAPGAMALAGRPGAARELARPWREAFGRWCFVEVRNLLEPGSPGEIRRLLRLAEEGELPAVATNAVRYLVSGDA
ncbi:MAG TPA: PHP domain-containing protein, partial [Actinomycetota bacterium]|nr:PHP domain-containing protein [Actinomycetota bacterium]